MVFNSLVFLLFIAVVLPLYYSMGWRKQNGFLLVASYVFYGWWDWRFLGLLVFTSIFDYWCAIRIQNELSPSWRRWFLAFSILLNMGVLGYFKYFNFFAAGFAKVLASFGMQADLPTLHVILPLGISFYTFLSMSYTIDVYRGHLTATRNLLDFMLYIAFFPHLVAGPIVRASFLLPQCQNPRTIQRDQVLNGIWLCLLGYVKKMVIADRLAGLVDWGFSRPYPPFHDLNAWIVLYAFAFQIYGDFAGYTDIARGLSKLMGFELVTNFRAPYLVTNPASFWRHWHISLSVWLRDYLYIPLGGNRGTSFRTLRNLMVTMLLGGLWHGAGIAYIAWGLYHGVLLVTHRLWRSLIGADRTTSRGDENYWNRDNDGSRLSRFGLIVIFFHITCIGWLFFRAGAVPGEIGQWMVIKKYLHAIFNPTLSDGLTPLLWPTVLLGALTLFFQWQYETMENFSRWRIVWQTTAVAVALTALFGFGVFDGSSFIYFQF